jgi:hypothetical protein
MISHIVKDLYKREVNAAIDANIKQHKCYCTLIISKSSKYGL